MKHWVLVKNNEVIAEYIQQEKPTIHANKGIVYEKVFASILPQPSATEKVVEEWIIDGDSYLQTFTLVDKSAREIALEGWHYPEYSMRIKISMMEVMTNPQLQQFVSQLVLWWNLTKLQHEVTQQYAYFYCNFIYEAHQEIINAFSQYIEIETLPNE